MVGEYRGGVGSLRSKFTHWIWYLEPDDIRGRIGCNVLPRKENSVESVRILDGILCGDAISMTDFSAKFEKLLTDISDIKISASESRAETKVLSTRLNGTVEKMNSHLDETETREQALHRLWVTIIVQIVSFAFFLGGIIWMVYFDNNKITELIRCQESFIKHMVKTEVQIDELRKRLP
jgi:hypothetical protein